MMLKQQRQPQEIIVTPDETGTLTSETYEMNAKWNSYGVFYDGEGNYYFSDPRGYDDNNASSENILNFVYRTTDFAVFEKIEPAQTYYQQNYMNWNFNEIDKALHDFENTGVDEKILAFNEYRNHIYYSTGHKLFTYNLNTQKRSVYPLLDVMDYNIAGINICGEKLFLGLVLEERPNFRGYFSNFGGAIIYVANLDGSDLREVVISQCENTLQTFNYKSQGFGISCPSYWFMCTDEGSYYSSLLMIISPKYDFFMTAGKVVYAKRGYIESSQMIETGKIKTSQGLIAEYAIYKGKEENSEKDLFDFYCSVLKGKHPYYFSAVGSYSTLEELKPLFIKIAENFVVLE
jgi:hypothetical protein